MRRLFIAIIAVGFLLTSPSAMSANKYSVGFSDTLIQGYLRNLGIYCTDPSTQECPDNFVSVSYNDIAYLLQDLVVNRHVGTFREVLTINMILPSSGGNNYGPILDALSIYSNYNVQLILTFAAPIPSYMSVTGSTYNIIPNDDASWTNLKNSLSNAVGDFVNAMWNSPNISRQWMSTRLYIEGYSEFNGATNPQGNTINSTPARAADLQNGIQFVLNLYGISVQTLMPSIVGGGQLPDGTYRTMGQFVSQYYAYGGSGLPNVQLYIPGAVVYTDVVTYMDYLLQEIVPNVPQSLQGRIVISEGGSADVTPGYCAPFSQSHQYPSIDPGQRQYEYAAVAQDPYINQNAQMLLFWRLMTLNPQNLRPGEDQCEAYFGVATYNGVGYTATGLNLFNYLNQ